MKITMLLSFWFFIGATILGMLLQQMSIGAAVTTFGLGGMIFVVLLFVIWLKEENDRRGY